MGLGKTCQVSSWGAMASKHLLAAHSRLSCQPPACALLLSSDVSEPFFRDLNLGVDFSGRGDSFELSRVALVLALDIVVNGRSFSLVRQIHPSPGIRWTPLPLAVLRPVNSIPLVWPTLPQGVVGRLPIAPACQRRAEEVPCALQNALVTSW